MQFTVALVGSCIRKVPYNLKVCSAEGSPGFGVDRSLLRCGNKETYLEEHHLQTNSQIDLVTSSTLGGTQESPVVSFTPVACFG